MFDGDLKSKAMQISIVDNWLDQLDKFTILKKLSLNYRLGSTVVQCLSRDRGVAGSSFTDITVLCFLEQDTLTLAYYWFNPG